MLGSRLALSTGLPLRLPTAIWWSTGAQAPAEGADPRQGCISSRRDGKDGGGRVGGLRTLWETLRLSPPPSRRNWHER